MRPCSPSPRTPLTLFLSFSPVCSLLTISPTNRVVDRSLKKAKRCDKIINSPPCTRTQMVRRLRRVGEKNEMCRSYRLFFGLLPVTSSSIRWQTANNQLLQYRVVPCIPMDCVLFWCLPNSEDASLLTFYAGTECTFLVTDTPFSYA